MESFFTNLESCLTVSPRKEVPNGLWILGMPSFWHGSHRSHGCWKLKEANGPPSGRNAATAQTDGVVPCAALALDLRFGTMAPQCPCSPICFQFLMPSQDSKKAESGMITISTHLWVVVILILHSWESQMLLRDPPVIFTAPCFTKATAFK